MSSLITGGAYSLLKPYGCCDSNSGGSSSGWGWELACELWDFGSGFFLKITGLNVGGPIWKQYHLNLRIKSLCEKLGFSNIQILMVYQCSS